MEGWKNKNSCYERAGQVYRYGRLDGKNAARGKHIEGVCVCVSGLDGYWCALDKARDAHLYSMRYGVCIIPTRWYAERSTSNICESPLTSYRILCLCVCVCVYIHGSNDDKACSDKLILPKYIPQTKTLHWSNRIIILNRHFKWNLNGNIDHKYARELWCRKIDTNHRPKINCSGNFSSLLLLISPSVFSFQPK